MMDGESLEINDRLNPCKYNHIDKFGKEGSHEVMVFYRNQGVSPNDRFSYL